MKQGTTVKFSNPQNEEEKQLRFTVLEDRDNRVLVQLVCKDYLKPTFVYLKTDLTTELN